MTVDGAERLKAELHRLKTVERPAVIQAIAEARSHGDLSENADYDAAKERQGFIEGRIAEVEAQARQRAGDRSRRDSTPTAASCSARRSSSRTPTAATQVTYQIVGDDEADIKHGKISISSPIARALIGKARGRHRRGAGARRRARVRGAGGPLRLRG